MEEEASRSARGLLMIGEFASLSGSAYKKIVGSAFLRLFIAIIIAIAALYLYDRRRIQWDQFMVEEGTASVDESWEGRPITAASIPTIDELVTNFSRNLSSEPTNKSIIWLGFSQLFTINQYKPGNHLAPYWLIEKSNCNGCMHPLGIALANANFQEYYVLITMILKRVPSSALSAIILTLPFDKLREDGLRDEFEPLMDDGIQTELRQSEIGREILVRWNQRGKATLRDESAGLRGFLHQRLEDKLTNTLSAIFPLWADRANLRSNVFWDLQFLRNAVLGIRPNTVRKVILPRYVRNMNSLDALMTALNRARIPILAYIAPVRSDVPTLYDPAEYETWKQEIGRLCAGHGAQLLNLETLVPGKYWGRTHGDWIDFMHFQGKGHELLAEALLPELRRLLDTRGGNHAVQ